MRSRTSDLGCWSWCKFIHINFGWFVSSTIGWNVPLTLSIRIWMTCVIDTIQNFDDSYFMIVKLVSKWFNYTSIVLMSNWCCLSWLRRAMQKQLHIEHKVLWFYVTRQSGHDSLGPCICLLIRLWVDINNVHPASTHLRTMRSPHVHASEAGPPETLCS